MQPQEGLHGNSTEGFFLKNLYCLELNNVLYLCCVVVEEQGVQITTVIMVDEVINVVRLRVCTRSPQENLLLCQGLVQREHHLVTIAHNII